MTLTAIRPEAPADPPPTRRARRARWRLPVVPLVIAVVCFLGVGVLLYPAAAAWMSQYQQSLRIDEYAHEVEVAGPDALAAELARAADYNAALTGGAFLDPDERIPQSDDAGAGYEGLLAADDDGLMARVRIPAIDVDLPIYHGTTEDVLERGVGHLEGTALPIGGTGTHAVLTAHRGLASAELFTNLDRVVVGDTFTVEVFGEVLTYRVRDTQVVAPDETETLYPFAGEDLVTLVTCTPLGINSHRILVTGERLLPTPPEDVARAGATPDIPGFPTWIVGLAGAAALLSLYVWWSGRPAPVRAAAAPARRASWRPGEFDGGTSSPGASAPGQ